jgi:deoxyribonuclease V
VKRYSFEGITPRQAMELQNTLRGRVVVRPLALTRIRFVAGADLSYEVTEKNLSGLLIQKNSNTVYGGIVVLSYPNLEIVDQSVVRVTVNFPYVPGLLSFRESPAIIQAWEHLTLKPDVLFIDGHGLAHPRRFGIACHLGLLFHLPTVGCAKSILVGQYDARKLKSKRGSFVPLWDGEERVGTVLRTREGVNPIFVTIGHLSDLRTARQLVLRCSPRYRIPEPTRQAHLLVNAARRGEVPIQ